MNENLFTTFAERVVSRALDVIYNRDCAWSAEEDAKRLLSILVGRCGIRNAISRGELRNRLHLNDRTIRELVHELRVSFGVQIGSSRGEDGGYYLMDDEADCLESSATMIRQGVAIIRAGVAMRGPKRDVVEVLGQISLALGETPKEAA